MKKKEPPSLERNDDHEHMPNRWIGCPIEDEYFGDERKATKLERKLASSNDRSRYKKTDKGKLEKARLVLQNVKLAKQDYLRGRVLSIISQGIIVEHDGKTLTCTLRGSLKKDKGSAKNLITVGDFVLFENISEGEGVIVQVEPRKSILSRADNLSRRKEQLIASNIDQVLITTSVLDPPLKPYLVDRYIIAAQKGGMKPVIIVNKIDLLEQEENEAIFIEKEIYDEFLKAYAAINIPVLSLSMETGKGLDALREIMKNQVSVFSGQSGVGKTSLINAITGRDLRVGRTVDKTRKGAHTTTAAQLLPLEFGGWCIDTPGIKSFGVWNLRKEEIEGYFSEIHKTGRTCRFPDCAHSEEEDCAVLKAVEDGLISLLRYTSYRALMISLSEEHQRR